MSEIRDPAQNESPSAPGEQGPSQNEEKKNNAAKGATSAEDDARGNRAAGTAGASAASEEDSIGNRRDEAAGGGAAAAGAPAQGKKAKKKDRPKEKGGAPAGGGQDKNREDPNQRRAFHVGDKVRARVVSLGPAAAIVDLWGKEQGVLDLRELTSADAAEPKVGDGVDVVVIQDGSRGGNLVVTRDPTRVDRAKEMVAQAFSGGEAIEGLVTGINRGGLEVDLSGLRAFCPSSQIDARFPPSVNPKTLVLTRQAFRVTAVVEDGKEAIVSRRALLEQDARARAEEVRATMKPGATVKGLVTAVKEYGVFVDLGGIEGLIHISELTHNRSARPQDVVKVGDEIEARVLKITGGARPEEEGKAEAAEKPEAADAKPEKEEGKDQKGKRDKKQQRRAEGLPRVMLSRRALEADPWDGADKRFPPGSIHAGKVARMQSFGAFVELAPGVDGLLHVSELGDGKRIEHPNEVLKEGQALNVRVEKVEKNAKRISLTLLPEGVTEEQLKTAVVPRVGLVLQASVADHDAHGVWVNLDGVVGKSQRAYLPDRETGQPRGAELRKVLPVGNSVRVKITEMDRGRARVSIRAVLHDEERQAYRAYQREANSNKVGVSLADKLRAKLSGITTENK